MNLTELKKISSAVEWRELASKVGTSARALENMVYPLGSPAKRPGVVMSKKLVAAEPRLTLHELRPDIWD